MLRSIRISGPFLIGVITTQGIFGSGMSVTLIAWCARKRGALFTAVFMPLMLVLVAIAGSLFLNEKLHLGRYIRSHVNLSTQWAQRIGPIPYFPGPTPIISFHEYVNWICSILGAGLIVCGLYVVLWGKGKETKMMNATLPSRGLREPDPAVLVVVASSTNDNGIDTKESTTDSGVKSQPWATTDHHTNNGEDPEVRNTITL